jgi:hypothetical protein
MFEPWQSSEETSCATELDLAYSLVYQAMDFGSALEYWKGNTEDQRLDTPYTQLDWSSASEDDSESDPDVREAIRISRIGSKRKNGSTLPTISTSPPKRRRSIPHCRSPVSPTNIRQHFWSNSNLITTGRKLPIIPKTQPADVVEGDL